MAQSKRSNNNVTLSLLNINNIGMDIDRYYFFLESFNLCHPLLMTALYHQIKTLISFWCRRELNPRSLIQPSETLPIELTGTHLYR